MLVPMYHTLQPVDYDWSCSWFLTERRSLSRSTSMSGESNNRCFSSPMGDTARGSHAESRVYKFRGDNYDCALSYICALLKANL